MEHVDKNSFQIRASLQQIIQCTKQIMAMAAADVAFLHESSALNTSTCLTWTEVFRRLSLPFRAASSLWEIEH
jgi:hypothetical protein